MSEKHEQLDEEMYLPKDNSEIEKYLDYYFGLESPGYAVFLNGPWGSGKTWFIRNFKNKIGEDHFIHISLYGVSTVDQIDGQMFKQLYPKLTSKKGKILTKGFKMAAGAFGFSIDDVDFREYLEMTTRKVIIFDDLERCENPSIALGFINRYIEQCGNRVIVIGEEDFLKSKDETFIKQKEKTIGRHFTIYPDFEATFNYFINLEAHSTVRMALKDNFSIIQTCFKRAGCKNLRTLRFCVTEFYRFFEQLPDKAKTHKEFLSESINTFFSLCVEFRSGHLDVDQISEIEEAFTSDITSRVSNRNSSEEIAADPLAELRKLHFGEGWNKIEPNLNMLYCFFKFGSVHPRLMAEAIDNNSHFHVDNTPDWIRLWHSHDITDDEFERCYKSVIKDYKELKFTTIGELRHIVGMLLKYGKDEMIPLSYEEVLDLSFMVVREMTERKLIESDPVDDDFRPFDDISNGMQFQSLKDKNFEIISKLIKIGAHSKFEVSFKEYADKIPTIMMHNVRKLRPVLTSGGDSKGEIRLHKYPVMKLVNVEAFVSSLIEMNPNDIGRFTVFHILKDRYDGTYLYPSLAEDLPWLKDVEIIMKSKLPSLRQPTKSQFNSLLVHLANIIKDVERNLEAINSQKTDSSESSTDE